jgi:hypothetical protein
MINLQACEELKYIYRCTSNVEFYLLVRNAVQSVENQVKVDFQRTT